MKRSHSTPHPRFSVIIPARNEEDFVLATIKSVLEQSTDIPYEVIVVDSASIDQTAKVAKDAGVRVVHESIAGLPRAREAGRRAARGEYLLYIDADTTMPPDYLNRVDAALRKQPKAVGVTNPNWLYDGTFAQNAVVFSFFTFVYPLQTFMLRLMGGSNQFIGGSFTVNAKVLEQAGGFNPEVTFYGEDTEVSKRVGRLGKIIFIYNLKVATSARRFHTNGLFKTTADYVRHFFAMALFNHQAENKFGRGLLKFLAVVAGVLLAERLIFHLSILTGTIAMAHHYVRQLTAQLDRDEVVLSLILLATFGAALSALISPRVQLFGPTINRMNTNEKFVALTFDDGPTPEATARVLEILKQHQVLATFFMIGQRVEEHPELARQVLAEGHGVGNHSYRHLWRLPFYSKSACSNDLKRTNRALLAAAPGAPTPAFYRPPHGWRTPWMLRAIRANHAQPVLWDIITRDFRPKYASQRITDRVLRRVKPGSIIVLHDGVAEIPGASRDNMIAALPHIIAGLQRRGYRFVRLQDLVN